MIRKPRKGELAVAKVKVADLNPAIKEDDVLVCAGDGNKLFWVNVMTGNVYLIDEIKAAWRSFKKLKGITTK